MCACGELKIIPIFIPVTLIGKEGEAWRERGDYLTKNPDMQTAHLEKFAQHRLGRITNHVVCILTRRQSSQSTHNYTQALTHSPPDKVSPIKALETLKQKSTAHAAAYTPCSFPAKFRQEQTTLSISDSTTSSRSWWTCLPGELDVCGIFIWITSPHCSQGPALTTTRS